MIFKYFNITKNDVITITGAGGKTSLLYFLAEELSKFGKVLITTTTKIFCPSEEKYESLIIGNNTFTGKNKNITVVGSRVENGKLHSLSYEEINNIRKNYDFVLIEGDGAKEKLLKEWNDYEPCIPKFSTKIIGVINMDIIDLHLCEKNIHRFELLKEKFPDNINKKITSDFLSKYILSADYFKNSNINSEKYLFFNGIDGKNYLSKFQNTLRIVYKLSENNFLPKIVMGSIHEKNIFPLKKLDAVIMASGFSKRMGKNKLSLTYNGRTILESTLEKIFHIPFNKVIICGREKWIEELASKYNFEYCYNSFADLGQSESIKLGIENSTGEGIVFFPGDQPLLSENTILNLYYEFQKTNLITVPTVEEKRFSPVFFPEDKKGELLKLEGDIGGKSVIKKTPIINLVKFSSEKEFKDIDTIEDYMYIINNKK
ncbi:selenium cofactor biosynthesis protein YqeC [Fusobacterium varium]|uniref:selenium cofactor biosynthesis protein YqeC n=1 Tax=Fusobacterium varium TaxID=856 RepID=UPI00243227DB|nr:selenium cofactor biosynthesis protein YqeC [Fusobacterium varium]MCI6031835.1 putative selenium-dependent hydroxylase accessory protein YqeC [Fusobacterium varium]